MILNKIYQKIIDTSDDNYISEPLIVGGVPRDIVLGASPGGDIDLTTNDADCPRLGISFASKEFLGFKMFEDGHVSVYTADYTIDFSSNFISPKAVEYLEDQLEISDANLFEVYSRDFTINTLQKKLMTDEFIDSTKLAEKDLDQRIIRTVTTPDICFGDDPRRLFRAINFASRLGLRIDGSIVDYCKNNIDEISSEIGKSLREAFLTSIVSKSISNDPEKTLGYLIDMNLLSLVPLVGAFKEELIKRRMVAQYLDSSSLSLTKDNADL